MAMTQQDRTDFPTAAGIFLGGYRLWRPSPVRPAA